jgi:hypothetical protein
MAPSGLARFARELAGIVTGLTVVSSAGLVAGAACAGGADLLDRNPYLWFLVGFFAASGALSLVFVSSWSVTRRLKRIKALNEQGLITQREAAQLRRQLLRWYSERLFGRASDGEEDVKPDSPDSPNSP